MCGHMYFFGTTVHVGLDQGLYNNLFQPQVSKCLSREVLVDNIPSYITYYMYILMRVLCTCNIIFVSRNT
jgi:hypothetical protein